MDLRSGDDDGEGALRLLEALTKSSDVTLIGVSWSEFSVKTTLIDKDGALEEEPFTVGVTEVKIGTVSGTLGGWDLPTQPCKIRKATNKEGINTTNVRDRSAAGTNYRSLLTRNC